MLVLDVNDCPPIFRSQELEAHVPEDAVTGDIVTTLSTVDADEGQNAAVTYSFLAGMFFVFRICR